MRYRQRAQRPTGPGPGMTANRKETIKKMKRQPTEWEKMLAKHISDKERVSRLHKEILQLNNKKISI